MKTRSPGHGGGHTGQAPMRRETDRQKRRRDEDAKVVEQTRRKKAQKLDPAHVKVERPWINQTGRLQLGLWWGAANNRRRHRKHRQ